MNTKRTLGLVLAIWALVAFVIPTTAAASDGADDPSVYFRPGVRFGTDDRTLYILDFLIPVYRGNKDLLFINTKFTPDDHEAWETNLGIGYRRLVLDDRLVLGGNLFYDHRKTAYGSHFDQLGLGFEAMAELSGVGLATRFNYYQPLTKAKLGEDFGYVFYGNGIYTAGIEEPMTGFDYEAGIRIPGISNYVETWAYAGGYHFFGNHVPDVNGVSARLEAMPTDFLRLNFEFRNDSVNHDQYYGEVAFEVPFSIENLVAGKNPFAGIGDVLTGSRTLKERMVEPVHRDVDIVVGKDYLSGLDAASGDGSLAAGVIFVADNADTGGDGSFEHPYNNLTDATDDGRLGDTVSIVHVLTGDGTGLSGETFGQDGITIWGAGANNLAYPYVTNFAQGYPIIISTLVLGGADMTVLGLSFDVSDPSAIEIGGGAANSGLSIFSNRIYSTGGYGIYGLLSGDIGASGSPAVISGNTISIDSSDGAGGILLVTDGSIYASIRDNRIGVITDSINSAYGICVATDGGDFTGSISGNTISGVNNGNSDAYGIYAEIGSGDFTGSISGNMISGVNSEDSDAYGISTNIGGTFTGVISQNTISDISGYSETVGIYTYGDYVGSISGNTISNVYSDTYTAYGIYTYITTGTLTGAISGNTISGIGSLNSGAYGISAFISNMAFTGSISGNTISDISGYGNACGISSLVNLGDFTGSISGNTISAITSDYGYAYGICANMYDADFTGSISGNSISGVDASWDYAAGIYLYGSNFNFSGLISGNTVSGINSRDSWAGGILTNSNSGDFTGSISDNTVSGVSGADWPDGIGFCLYGGTFTGTISGNTITGVTDISYGHFADGIFGLASGGMAGTISDNTVTGITSPYEAAGIYLYSYDYITTSITNNYLEVTAGDYAYGLYANSHDGSIGTLSSPLVFTGNSGTIKGTAAYAAYLSANYPDLSNVYIGNGKNGMGDNDFVSSVIWSGNYPEAGGPIWATDNGSFIHP